MFESAPHIWGVFAVYRVMMSLIPFARVVELHGSTVLRVCRALLRSNADAEDAWSETFLSALRAYSSLDETANLEAWLVTIARRKALDVLRRNAREVLVESLPDEQSVRGLPHEDASLIWADVAKLAPKQRQVIAYRYFAGLSYAEIATAVGGTPAAARRSAADGLAVLRSRTTTEQRDDEHELENR